MELLALAVNGGIATIELMMLAYSIRRYVSGALARRVYA